MDVITDTYSQLENLPEADQTLLRQVYEFTEKYFRNPKFDSSHDFKHVLRVVKNSLEILHAENKADSKRERPLDPKVIVLGALLHDVGDRKYIEATDVGIPLAEQKLIELGMSGPDAASLQELIDGVSYSSEIKAPERVQALIQWIPELAVVQDADRLDAIGAIGIGRCFTFGGAHAARSLGDSIQHFEDKLLKLQGMMKTETGRRMAAERSERLTQFMRWWESETTVSGPA